MHLRRALLLFAIVLGLAAVAAAVSRPRHDEKSPATTSTLPSAEPRSTPASGADVTFDAERERSHAIDAGQAATVYVKVPEAGQVSIDRMGMTDAAEPDTPAEFDVLTSIPGHYPILFVPAGASEGIEAGTLVVR